jgi:Zn-dependent M28 family amino/carboxypeptidase
VTLVRASLLLAAVLLVSACVGAPTSDVGDGTRVDAPTTPDRVAAQPSGLGAYELLYDFAMDHPNRHNEDMNAKKAAQSYLQQELSSRGLEVIRSEYSATGTNILGIHEGTTRADEWVVFSCHYDIIRQTIYGARDDGLGCAALLEMASAFSRSSWNRTLVFAFFDEEELGLIGSKAFVAEYASANESTVVANLNFDPAGLHHPCGDASGTYPVFLVITEAKVDGPAAVPGYQEVLDAARSGYLQAGVPSDKIRVSTAHAYLRVDGDPYSPPGSDDDSFDRADIPSIWMGSPPADEVGPVAAWGYPNHTPVDTADVVEARCGSAETLVAGLETAMDAALTALWLVDAQVWDG